MNSLLNVKYAQQLQNVAEERAEEYHTAHPFPHIILDNFMPERVVTEIIEKFPRPNQLKWKEYDEVEEKKLAFSQVEQLPEAIIDVMYFLNSAPVLRFLESLTGIQKLIPDPYYEGGGLHQIETGGYLNIHADFNKYERLNLDRRLNLLLYLNQDWEETYGGHLELWDRNMTTCVKKILPIFNRCVIFSTTDYSYHGHPNPLTCPPDRTRRSLATYYYTNGRPEEEYSTPHTTLFQRRPGEVLEERMTTNRIIRRKMVSLLPSSLRPVAKNTYFYLRRKFRQ